MTVNIQHYNLKPEWIELQRAHVVRRVSRKPVEVHTESAHQRFVKTMMKRLHFSLFCHKFSQIGQDTIMSGSEVVRKLAG